MWHTVEIAIRAHQWTGWELVAVSLVATTFSFVAVDVIVGAWGVARRAWQCRSVRRLQAGGANGYADPGRVHRETLATVDRVARAAAARVGPAAAAVDRAAQSLAGGRQSGAARPVDPWGVDAAAGLRVDPEGRPAEGAAHAATRDAVVSPLPPGAPLGRGLGREAGYGESTTLIFFPGDPTKRVSGHGHHV